MLDYSDVREQLGTGRSHLLLGNGFSIGCDPVFRYDSLYETAVGKGLSDKAQAVFQRLGTSNFEGVMRLLGDARWVAELYTEQEGTLEEIEDDIEVVKRTLVQAVATNHLEHTGKVSDGKKSAAYEFIEPFHNVFTTNYDLLAYWVIMSQDPPRFQDGFREDEDDPDGDAVVFSERLGRKPGLLYLHGGLHLFLAKGDLKKRCWSRTHTPLIELIRAGLEDEEYPLFVAEGEPESKLRQIQRVGYLWYVLDKLARVSSPLVVYGHSLGPSDQHIVDALVKNFRLSKIFLGVYGDEESDAFHTGSVTAGSLRDQRDAYADRWGRRKGSLEVVLFDSRTAGVWEESSSN